LKQTGFKQMGIKDGLVVVYNFYAQASNL